jgi:ribosomal protein S18 acetylase RimI-like enzyme
MEIVNCTLQDIDTILSLYKSATEYQKANGFNEWKEFERDLIISEIDEKRIWKIVMDGDIACVFTVAYSDPVIWPSSEGEGEAIYLHRITTNPAYKGRNMVQYIIAWSKEHCKETDSKFIRMDTWADNNTLINYYIKCGFRLVGGRKLDKDIAKDLPKHYSTLSLVLLEIGV